MSLLEFFEAKSVALVGASRTKGKVGYEILASLIAGGFEGAIYPINPNVPEFLLKDLVGEGVVPGGTALFENGVWREKSLRCYPSLTDIGAVPDLAVVVVPAKAVPDVIRECGRIGTKKVIIIAGGFKETGDKGRELEEEVLRLARQHGIRLVGPNCLGLMSPRNKLNASFGGTLPIPGVIGYMSQSGSLLAAIADKARAIGMGFSRLISIGNKADINELDVLKMLGEDEQTQVIAGYLETIADGDAFIREAERISHDKPILLLKAGDTSAGAIAASSHTGRMLGAQQAVEMVFERAGIIRCPSITAQFDYARALASQPLPKGDRVAIIANAGGAGIMAADSAELHGLSLATLSDATQRRLTEHLPSGASTHNPIDLLGDALADRFQLALEAALDDPSVDCALVLLTPHAMTEPAETARAIVEVVRQKADKPVLASFIGADRVRQAMEILRAGNVPPYESPEFAIGAAKVLADYGRWRRRPVRVITLFPVNRPKVETILARHLRAHQQEVGEMEAHEVLEAYGFVTPKGLVATSAEQAATFADQIGYPVVLKIWSPDIVHKSEIGGVRAGLSSAQEVMDAFDLMMYRIPRKCPNCQILGVLVQEMCKKGTEFILGMNRDPRYGPLMMFGMGGIFVEMLRDVSFHLAPLTAQEAKEMLIATKTFRILKDYHEQNTVDIDAIAEGLQRLSQLVTEHPQIQEMDINPFIVGRQGTTPVAVDAHIAVGDGRPHHGEL